MTDFIAIVILAAVLFAAARYVYRAKKSGVKCVGCPSGGSCCCGKSGAHEDAAHACPHCSGKK